MWREDGGSPVEYRCVLKDICVKWLVYIFDIRVTWRVHICDMTSVGPPWSTVACEWGTCVTWLVYICEVCVPWRVQICDMTWSSPPVAQQICPDMTCHTATHCAATHCLQHTATHCVASHCNTLRCNTLQHTAPYRTATYCNTLEAHVRANGVSHITSCTHYNLSFAHYKLEYVTWRRWVPHGIGGVP